MKTTLFGRIGVTKSHETISRPQNWSPKIGRPPMSFRQDPLLPTLGAGGGVVVLMCFEGVS